MKATVALIVILLAAPTMNAASEPLLATMINKTAIMIDAPYPFVESSKLLPELFAQRKKSMAASNQLLAWFVPIETVRQQLGEKGTRFRSLQVQVLRAMEKPEYSADDIVAFRDDLVKGAPNMASITDDNLESMFTVYDLSNLSKEAGTQKVLGITKLAENSFTLCIATSVEAMDKSGGLEIETSISAVTYLLLRDKVLLITVTGPSLTAKELGNAFRITREWVRLLREINAEK